MTLYAIHFNRPDFIRIQFDLAVKNGYKFIVVNNGGNENIKKVCLELGIERIDTVNNANGSVSHGSAINQILGKIDYNEDYGIIDHDLFIHEKLYFNGFDIIGRPLTNGNFVPYLWAGLMIFRAGIDIRKIDFLPYPSIRGDTGCMTYDFIKSKNVKWCDVEYVGESSVCDFQNKLIFEKYSVDGSQFALHYVNGSNWTKKCKMEEKNNLLKEMLK